MLFVEAIDSLTLLLLAIKVGLHSCYEIDTSFVKLTDPLSSNKKSYESFSLVKLDLKKLLPWKLNESLSSSFGRSYTVFKHVD